jgi:hypothetical protein
MLQQGTKGCEAAFYLAGKTQGADCLIDTLCIPHQKAWSVEDGCALMVEGKEFTRLGRLVEQSGREFCGQLHSHPDEAFHSPPDDRNPTMRFEGALSIVTPRFGLDGVLPRDAAVFRFDLSTPGWLPLSRRARKGRIHIGTKGTVQVLGIE